MSQGCSLQSGWSGFNLTTLMTKTIFFFAVTDNIDLQLVGNDFISAKDTRQSVFSTF